MLTDLDITTSIEKNVVTLDVTMDDALLVQMFKAAASLIDVRSGHAMFQRVTYLKTNGGDLVFGDGWIVVNDISQSTALHILHDNPELSKVVAQEGIQKVDNVSVLAVLHDHDFIDDQLLSRLVCQVHLLDSNLGLAALLAHNLSGNWR